jgi:hypothetical protein
VQTQPPSSLAPPSTPAAAAALEAEMDRSASHEHIARLAVHLARAYAEATAIFSVRHDLIEGLVGEGMQSNLAGTLLPAAADSVFANVVASGTGFRGTPPKGGLEEKVLRALGRDHVGEIGLFPIAIRGRVVNLLYADNGPEVLGDASAAALGAVCTRVARAYARLILERKALAHRPQPSAALGSMLLRA